MVNNNPSNWFMETMQAAGDKMVAAFDSFMTWLINDGALGRGLQAASEKASNLFAAMTPHLPSGHLETPSQTPSQPATARGLEIQRVQEHSQSITPNHKMEEIWEKATRTQTRGVSVEQLQSLANTISAPEHVGAEIFSMAPNAYMNASASLGRNSFALAS